MTQLPLAAPTTTMSEADWQQRVMDTARALHWRVAHHRPAQVRNGRWATPTSGDVGVPDLLLARDGMVLLVELKRHNTRPTPGQRLWLAALGTHGRLWRPQDWDEVLATLRDGPTDQRETGMTAPIPSATIDDVLFAAGLGVARLRGKVTELDTALEEYVLGLMRALRVIPEAGSSSPAGKLAESARKELTEWKRIDISERLAREESEQRALRNLRDLDRITLALALYIPELEAARDTAKTKAAGIALGHVVERLREIRYADGEA